MGRGGPRHPFPSPRAARRRTRPAAFRGRPWGAARPPCPPRLWTLHAACQWLSHCLCPAGQSRVGLAAQGPQAAVSSGVGGLGDAAEAGLPPVWASPRAELTSARPCPPPPPPTSCPLPGLMLRPPRPRAEELGGGRTQLSCPPRARPPVYPCDSPVPRGSCTEKGRPPHAQRSRSPPPPPSSLFNCQTGTGSVSPPQPPPASGLSGGVGSRTPAPLIPGLREGPCRGSGWGWPDLPLGSGATLGLAGCPAVWGRGFGSPASVVLGVWGR